MIKVIRARKVGKRKAWEELGDRYLAVEQKVPTYTYAYMHTYLCIHTYAYIPMHAPFHENIS